MHINPYIKFNDNKCREGMAFYKDALGGELEFQTIGESPMAKDVPKEGHNKIMHSTLKKGSTVILYGADMMRDKAVIGDNVTVSVNVDKEDDARKIFQKLSAGGELFFPIDKVPWGAIFGMVTDKYGVEWMVNCPLK